MDCSVVTALQKSPLGAGFTLPELIALAGRLPVVDLDAGQALLQAGEPADAAYVLLEGELEIRAPDGTWLDRELPGALVGEQALLPDGGGRRNATVLATEASRLLRVEARLFQELLSSRPERRQQVEADSDARTRNHLGRLSGSFRRLLEASERRSWEEGEVVFEEGDPADGLHLILAGRAAVVTEKDGAPVHLSTVYPGQCFGEIATLRDLPRTATVVARGQLRTAFVPAEKARALYQEHPELEAFLDSLLRSYELRRGALHQRSVLRDGRACIETVYILDDGRQLTALRDPEGRYTLETAGAAVAKAMQIAAGTTVSLDAEHRVVALEDAGQYEDIAALQALALEGEPLSVHQRRELRGAAREAALQAPDALICRCLGLERAVLQAAIDAGADTAEALKAETGCGTVCGGCMRKAVPAMLPTRGDATSPRPAAPALPAKPSGQLPPMPRLIPWLGNFSFSRDPAGFQRQGHKRLGPVFGAHLMGVDFVFVDPARRPALLARVLSAPAEELDAAAAWQRLVGKLLGDELIAIRPDLALQALPATAREALERTLAAQLGAGGPVDLLALAGEAVAGLVCVLRPAPGGDSLPAAEVARQMDVLESDLSALGALMPIETPAARRRIEARRWLEERLGREGLALLVAVFRNAKLAVVAALLDLLARPEELERVRAEIDATPDATRSIEGLRSLPALHRALAESVRLRGGGAIWRRASRPIELEGATVPEGALVGAVMALASQPDGDGESGRGAVVGGTGALFDEGFGTRGPAEALPEAAATLVLARLLAGWNWRLVDEPKRWLLPIVPGMSRPRGDVSVSAIECGGDRDRPGADSDPR